MDRLAPKIATIEQLLAAGRAGDALPSLLRLVQAHGHDHRVLWLAGVAYGALNEPARSAHYAERACRAAPPPGSAPYCVGLANALFNLGKEDPARAALLRALQIDPACAAAHEALAELEFQGGRVARAAEHCRDGLRHDPANPGLRTTLAAVMVHLGDVAKARDFLLDPAFRDSFSIETASILCQTCHYLSGVSIQQTHAAAVNFQRMLDELLPGDHVCPVRDPRADRRLRLGILSGELRTHSVAYFMEPLLEHLHRHAERAFELYFYSVSGTRDAVTDRFRALASGAWREVPHLDALGLRDAIRADGIDILVETSGHTDAMRLPTLHLRAAPVQVSYCGYPGLTGVRAIDARIVDSTTDPIGPAPQSPAGSERIVRLDPCFLCYRPPSETPELSDAAPMAGAPVHFGSFNTLQKVNDEVLATWGRILALVPESRLILKSGALRGTDLRDRTLERLAHAGITPDRCDLLAATPTTREHLLTYARVDVGLDTFPYCGTTTTCEALLMGTPVVSLEGDRHASRVGATLLRAVDRPDLIAPDADGYVARAIDLARRGPRLLADREGLRARVRTGPLGDEAGHAARFAHCLRDLWRSACSRA
ncbi:MAG: O-linked N-acetylglucosamine transferase, SPINDLY family protein [Phycisphaerales bacterium]